jgi:hypothetical protein
MSHEPHEGEQSLFSRRQFLDVVSKSVIATAAFCILPMSEGAANAKPKPPKGGGHGASPYAPYGGCDHNPKNPYNAYAPYGGCDHNPKNPYNAYAPYGGCDHNPKNPYHAYNPYHCYRPYVNPVNPYSTYNPYA